MSCSIESQNTSLKPNDFLAEMKMKYELFLRDNFFSHKSKDLLFRIAIPLLIVALSCPRISIAESTPQTVTFKDLIYSGMDAFRREDISSSVKMFDEALVKAPEMYPYLWQRGLSLYYANDYAKCSAQFNFDTKINSKDYEETIWASICENGLRRQSVLPTTASGMLFSKSLPFRDQRTVMNDIQTVFSGASSPESLLNNAVYDDANNSKGFFYTRLYMGLFFEARGLEGDAVRALNCMQSAVRSTYGKNHAGDDYMVSVARVHYNLRQQQSELLD